MFWHFKGKFTPGHMIPNTNIYSLTFDTPKKCSPVEIWHHKQIFIPNVLTPWRKIHPWTWYPTEVFTPWRLLLQRNVHPWGFDTPNRYSPLNIWHLKVSPVDCATSGSRMQLKKINPWTFDTPKKFSPLEIWHPNCATGGSGMQQASAEAVVAPSRRPLPPQLTWCLPY